MSNRTSYTLAQANVRNGISVNIPESIVRVDISESNQLIGDYYPKNQSSTNFSICVKVRPNYITVCYDNCLPSAYDEWITLTGNINGVKSKYLTYDLYTYFSRNTTYYAKSKMVTVTAAIKFIQNPVDTIMFSYKATISKYLSALDIPSFVHQEYDDMILYKEKKLTSGMSTK